MKPRKRIKIKEADNGFIVECYIDGANMLVGSMPVKIEVVRDKKELNEFIGVFFSEKELTFIESNAIQEEEMQDEGEM